MSRPNSFMPMYWGDYLKDTGHLCAAEHGAYLLLIGHYWTTGQPLPADDEALRRIARMERAEWKRHGTAVLRFFTADGDVYRHSRIDAEIEQAIERYERRSQAGRKGNAKRWKGDDGTVAKPSQCDPKATELGSQPQPQPHSPIGEDGGGSAHARPPPHPSDPPWKRVLSAMGVLNDPRWTGNGTLVTAWLQAGCDLDMDIIPTIERLTARLREQGQGPPASLKYFDRPIMQAKADRLRNLEEPAPHVRRSDPSRTQAPRGAAAFAAIAGLGSGSGDEVGLGGSSTDLDAAEFGYARSAG